MAFVKATKAGNWSDASVWSTSAVPQNGNCVYANGFSVQIDQNVTIGDTNNVSVNAGSFVTGCRYVITTVGTTTWTSIGAASNTIGVIFTATGAGSGSGIATTIATISTAAVSTAAAGGGFTIAGNYNVYADIISGTTFALTVSTGNYTFAIKGNITGGGSSNINGILNNSTGTVTVTGNITGGSGNTAYGFVNNSTGTVAVTGSINGGNATAAVGFYNTSSGIVTITGNVSASYANTAHGFNNNSTGTVTITGNVTGGGYASTYGILNNSTGTVTVTGNITGGAVASGYGITNASTGILTVTGGLYASSNGAAAVYTLTATSGTQVILKSSAYNHANGTSAILCNRYCLGTTLASGAYQISLNGTTTTQSLYTSDNVFAQAIITDVRAGTIYASGTLTGTCAIPGAGSVALGVAVDATTGTAVLTPADVWNALTSGMTTSGSIGERLKNAATTATTGQALADALNA